MNIKKIIVLLIFAIAIIGIIAPVEAKLSYCETWSYSKEIKGETVMMWGVCSDIGSMAKNWDSPKYAAQNRAEVNKVNKVTVTIKGYKTKTFNKPLKGWKFSGITGSSLYKEFSVKGNPNGKSFNMKCYDKKGKVIKQHIGKVEYIPWHQRL
jgi:hypothetical protein